MTIELVKILEAALDAWNTFVKYYDDAANTDDAEMLEIYENLGNRAHASFSAYYDCYRILTGKSICGLGQLEAELAQA